MRQLITNAGQIGAIFRGRRKALKLSQEKLAARLDISQERLSKLESAPAGLTLERVLVLAKLLGLELVLQDQSPAPRARTEW